MKKNILLTVCLMAVATTASAQFKIHSNGNMSFKRSSSTQPYSPISLKSGGAIDDSIFFISYKGALNGLKCDVTNAHYTEDEDNKSYGGYFSCSGTSETLVGLKGSSGYPCTNFQNVEPGSIGLWGSCSANSTQRYGYGVLGNAYGTDNSAAVCGIASGSSLTAVIPDDHYAGLFVGKAKVTGQLTALGGINGTLLSRGPSAPAGEALAGDASERCVPVTEPLADKILGLNALSFSHPQDKTASGPEPTFLKPDKFMLEEMERQGIDITKAGETEKDIIADQIQTKRHYALSAEELEEVLPDLVYTDKDGSKAINYVEMVPLLVQCINELNARLTAMDGGSTKAETRASRAGTAAIEGTPIAGGNQKSQAVLYQNTPNPFTAQTEIRFSLPDNATNAYIYIFDMQGKMQKQIPVNPSMQSVTINGYELQAGIYLYSLVVGGQEIDTKRMILSK